MSESSESDAERLAQGMVAAKMHMKKRDDGTPFWVHLVPTPDVIDHVVGDVGADCPCGPEEKIARGEYEDGSVVSFPWWDHKALSADLARSHKQSQGL